jgi:hypothetical protein
LNPPVLPLAAVDVVDTDHADRVNPLNPPIPARLNHERKREGVGGNDDSERERACHALPARRNLRIRGRRVAREAAMTPRPSSTQDQMARPWICAKKELEFSTSAGMNLKRTMEATLPLLRGLVTGWRYGEEHLQGCDGEDEEDGELFAVIDANLSEDKDW